MATATLPKLLTYHDYLRTPEMMKRYEIIDGALEFMAPAPNKMHQVSLARLHLTLAKAAKGRGEVFLAPFDIIISRKPLRTRQPDLFFVRSERLQIVKNQVEEGPDVVVEILSPSNRRKLVLEKLADYAAIGVKECWMVDTEARTLEIWRNRDGRFRPVARFRAGQKVRSQAFPVFTLPAAVFPSTTIGVAP